MSTAWSSLDLTALKSKDEEIEITVAEEEAPATPAAKPAPVEKEEEVVEGAPEGGDKPEGGEVESEEGEPKKKGPTRSQRLKHQRDRERARAEQAEAALNEVARQLQEERTQKAEALKVGAEKYTKNLDSLLESAERELESALADPDPKKQAAAQRKLAELVAERSRVPDVVAQAKEPEQRPAPQQQQGPQYHPKAISWAKSQASWFGQDKVLTAAAYAIDADLAAEGWDKGSDDYYQELETRLAAELPKRWKQSQAEEEDGDEPTPRKKAPAGPAAPGGSGKSPKSATLTPGEAEEARRLGVSYKDYYNQKVLLEQKSANGYATILTRK